MAKNSVCSQEYTMRRVVIIGAGIAGLSCANRLRQLGFKNVLILEAQDRIGGRIYSTENGSNILELGAQWIHGQEKNSIYHIAKSKDLVNTDAFNCMDAVKGMSNLCKEERDTLKQLFSFLEDKLDNFSDTPCSSISISKYLDDQVNYFKSTFDQLSPDIITKGHKWFCKFMYELNGCNDLSTLSLKLLSNYEECGGDPHVELKNGYSSVLDIFLSLIPDEWILKNTHVTKIDWSDFNQSVGECETSSAKNYKSIKIYCDNGNTYLADHTVITLPLGFLKKHSQVLFNPSLSDSKSKAIQCIGFGTVNKIFLQFNKPFWKEPNMFLVFENHLNTNIKGDSIQSEASLKHWTQSINRFAYTPNNPNMLCVWVAGKGAALMECVSDNEIIDDCMQILENILGKKLPSPTKILRSSWYSNPYSCGSYSHLTVACEEQVLLPSTLAEPEYASSFCNQHPVLMFAGEATHDSYYSTVHGAYDTGIREAERLFSHYSEFSISSMADPWESMVFKFNNLSTDENSLKSSLHIVIVGAGIAGLACAFQLTKNNFNNISIFEAQDKIGGRVSTVDCDDHVLELGAQWIHGQNNALYDFSNAHKLLPYLQKVVNEGKGLFCTSDGEVVDDEVVEHVAKVVNAAKQKIDKGNYDKKCIKSVKDFLTEEFNNHANGCCGKSNLCLERSIFDWFLRFEVVDNACDDLSDIAVQSFTEWDDCPDELYHITYEKGFESVLNALLSYVPKSSLCLNMPIKSIKWNEHFIFENKNYENRTNDNFPIILECENQSIYADSVIVTASAGFLKENVDSFFLPPLPHNKVEAINKIGFGTINKIYLVYENPFWNPKDRGFHLVWKNNGKGKCEQLCAKNPWITGITGFDILDKDSNILLGWVGGKEAKLMESLKEENISDICTELLRIFLDNPNIPKPIRTLRSNWYSNPYIRGSYSNRTPSYYEDENTLQNLQAPLFCKFATKSKKFQWPILLLSGEATDECSFSSAHGAYNSGIRVAENVMKICSEIETAIKEEKKN
ncbi:hypothetical protein JTE90_007102 [Oedothorax gibbosus]|uniref:Amine oxidase domain-containing protein n=1 Tax=Oedothorax gibbosus TaxID=931172 RepID=A0AAV6VSP9_9ARAC|nr:hypothetical protein JTE90_007102 [Oedothorax gibbosus]